MANSLDTDTTIVCDDSCDSFQEEIGGVLITYKNLVGFHYRQHYTYDPTPRLVGEIVYPTCDTIDCDIFGQDEER